jgi:hypothetical protein
MGRAMTHQLGTGHPLVFMMLLLLSSGAAVAGAPGDPRSFAIFRFSPVPRDEGRMLAMADSLENYRDRLLQALREASNGTIEQREALLDIVALGAARYDDLDERSRYLVERVSALLMAQITDVASAMPSSPEQRTLRRVLDTASGAHYTSRGFLESLERPPTRFPDFAQEMDVLCIATIQEVADLVHDVNQKVARGKDFLSFGGLITECIQEGVFALHAIRHGFPRQALAHCRAMYENLDLLALFRQDAAARDLWLGGENEQIRKKLSPRQVREQLGRKGKDMPYAFLSEHGTHPSIMNVSARSRVIPADEGSDPRMQLFVTGTWQRDALLPASMALCFQVHHMLLEAIAWSQHFKTGLDENWDRLDRTTALRAEFMRNHVVPWMREKKVPEAKIRALSGLSDETTP